MSEKNYITLYFDDGDPVETEILTQFTLDNKQGDGQEYVALLPLEADEAEDGNQTIFFFRIEEDDFGNPKLENIMNEEERDLVFEIFNQIVEESENDVEAIEEE